MMPRMARTEVEKSSDASASCCSSANHQTRPVLLPLLPRHRRASPKAGPRLVCNSKPDSSALAIRLAASSASRTPGTRKMFGILAKQARSPLWSDTYHVDNTADGPRLLRL